ncbi:MAG: tetrahydrofolate dehydrogenase/cyclohydrolase catalytic domain-containing protein, partial [Myxococcota bacterium]
MTATILDGKALAKAIRQDLAKQVSQLVEAGVTPGLAVILAGDDPASAIYVRNKERAAGKVGIASQVHRLPATASQAEVLDLVGQLNSDPAMDGFIVQVPLPDQVDPIAVQDAIAPGKDVDGFTAENIGLLAQGRPRFVAATPLGCMRLIAESGIELSGKKAVVVGRSNIVGKPVAMLLTNASATVTICHSRTADLAA